MCLLGRTVFLKPLKQRPRHMPTAPLPASVTTAIWTLNAWLVNWRGVSVVIGVAEHLAPRLWWGSENQTLLTAWAFGLIGGVLPTCWCYGCAFLEGLHEDRWQQYGVTEWTGFVSETESEEASGSDNRPNHSNGTSRRSPDSPYLPGDSDSRVRSYRSHSG